MRHSLTQFLAASSGRGRPREAGAACAPAGGPGQGAGDEAERRRRRRRREQEADSLGEPEEEEEDEDEDGGGGGDDEEEEEEAAAQLLFPGLDLEDWLEAAVAEARPDWDDVPALGGSSGPGTKPERPTGPGGAQPGNHRLKAAAAARLNRQKKKQYVLGLETRLQGLAAENRQLRDRNRGLCRRLRHLERETGYLRAVLANQSALGRLLSHLAGPGRAAAGLRITTSLFEDFAAGAPSAPGLPGEETCSTSSDHDYARPAPKEDEEDAAADQQDEEEQQKRPPSSNPGGVCLHVDRDQVSVEFCSLCARRAASSAFAAASPPSCASFASKM